MTNATPAISNVGKGNARTLRDSEQMHSRGSSSWPIAAALTRSLLAS